MTREFVFDVAATLSAVEILNEAHARVGTDLAAAQVLRDAACWLLHPEDHAGNNLLYGSAVDCLEVSNA